MVSERHIQGYKETMLAFYGGKYDAAGGEGHALASFGPVIDGEVGEFRPIHQTVDEVLSAADCQTIIDEAEELASVSGWSTKRHGSYPTTDLPLQQLPRSLAMFNERLEQVVLPTLGVGFASAIPGSMTSLRVADAFVVKYSVAGGQTELKPHRDGSVLSFNIALNDLSEYEGGGTWFASIDQSLRLERGRMLMHASGVKHGGAPITAGTRYILVGFVILESYQNVAMRFMKTCWDR
jgi:predicted 2-oxoglutarate/Fe(II)-dependent dioxygenase YbiX